MELTEMICRVDAQERELELKSFTNDDAWALGCLLRNMAAQRRAPVAIEVRRASTTLFVTVLEGGTADNVDWLRRKFAVVARFERSSYGVALMLRHKGTTLVERYGLELKDYAAAGGAVPIRVVSAGVVGAVGISGLAQEADHTLVCEALAALQLRS
jgi:uncharacterized protein (UPF0303 family)